jgi:cobalt/nickel transport protein
VSRRVFLVTGLIVALLLAGVASFYASSSPDGLERVAEQTGFLDSAEDSPTGDGPVADYRTDGVEDDRVSGGLAGVVGSLVVLVLAGGLFAVVRRRSPQPDPDDREHADSSA